VTSAAPGGLDRGDLGRAPGEEELLEAFELLGPDRFLDHLDAALAGEVDHRAAGDPVEETVGGRG
jgi:hypothetical protein